MMIPFLILHLTVTYGQQMLLMNVNNNYIAKCEKITIVRSLVVVKGILAKKLNLNEKKRNI